MQFRGHPQVQFAAVRLLRLHTVSLASLNVAVDASLEVLPELIERLSLISYQVLAQALHLTHQAVVLPAVFYATLVALVF